MPDAGRIVEESVSQQPPDLPIADRFDIEDKKLLHQPRAAADQLENEDDDVDANKPFADHAAVGE